MITQIRSDVKSAKRAGPNNSGLQEEVCRTCNSVISQESFQSISCSWWHACLAKFHRDPGC